MKTAFTVNRLKMLAQLAGASVCVMGLMVLLGWVFNIAALKNVLPGWPKVSPVTAFCFVLSGFSLWGAAGGHGNGTAQRTSQVCAFVVAVIGLAKLSGHVFDWNLSFDTLGFHDVMAAGDSPARMAHATALNFLLIGGALFLAGTSRRIGLFQVIVLLCGLISWLGFSHYLYGGKPLLPYAQMSLITATCFLLLSAGAYCVRTDGGLIPLFMNDSAGGSFVRRLLPPALLIPFLVGWLRLKAQQAGWFGLEAGLALFALSNVILFAALIWGNAALLHRADLRCKQSEGHLNASFKEVDDLKAALDEHAIVAITDPEATGHDSGGVRFLFATTASGSIPRPTKFPVRRDKSANGMIAAEASL